VLCTFGKPHRLAPAETITQTVGWDGRRCQGRTPVGCPGTFVSPGTYRVTARWQSEDEASTSLHITP
jgi:hypothetical protein